MANRKCHTWYPKKQITDRITVQRNLIDKVGNNTKRLSIVKRTSPTMIKTLDCFRAPIKNKVLVMMKPIIKPMVVNPKMHIMADRSAHTFKINNKVKC